LKDVPGYRGFEEIIQRIKSSTMITLEQHGFQKVTRADFERLAKAEYGRADSRAVLHSVVLHDADCAVLVNHGDPGVTMSDDPLVDDVHGGECTCKPVIHYYYHPEARGVVI
jgi:hypothetical protein